MTKLPGPPKRPNHRPGPTRHSVGYFGAPASISIISGLVYSWRHPPTVQLGCLLKSADFRGGPLDPAARHAKVARSRRPRLQQNSAMRSEACSLKRPPATLLSLIPSPHWVSEAWILDVRSCFKPPFRVASGFWGVLAVWCRLMCFMGRGSTGLFEDKAATGSVSERGQAHTKQADRPPEHLHSHSYLAADVSAANIDYRNHVYVCVSSYYKVLYKNDRYPAKKMFLVVEGSPVPSLSRFAPKHS